MRQLIYVASLGAMVWAGQGFSTPASSDKPLLTTDELQQVRLQLKMCWKVPKQLVNEDNLIIDMVVNLNADATIQKATLVDKANRYQTDLDYRDMADSVILALKNPLCKTLKLPPDKYQEWYSMQIRFDPQEMRKR